MTIVFILSYAAVFMFGALATKLGYLDTLIAKMSKENTEPPTKAVDVHLQKVENHARVLDMP